MRVINFDKIRRAVDKKRSKRADLMEVENLEKKKLKVTVQLEKAKERGQFELAENKTNQLTKIEKRLKRARNKKKNEN